MHLFLEALLCLEYNAIITNFFHCRDFQNYAHGCLGGLPLL